MSEFNPERAKMLGDLVEKAREHFGRTKKECAAVLGVKPDEYKKIESGEYAVSLPQLEALALYLNIPMGYFWGSEPLKTESEIDFTTLISLRHRVIGVLLSQQRLRSRQSLAEMAEALDIDEALLKSYEMGEEPIPYLHLEQICRQLDVSVSYFWMMCMARSVGTKPNKSWSANSSACLPICKRSSLILLMLAIWTLPKSSARWT